MTDLMQNGLEGVIVECVAALLPVGSDIDRGDICCAAVDTGQGECAAFIICKVDIGAIGGCGLKIDSENFLKDCQSNDVEPIWLSIWGKNSKVGWQINI